MKKEMNKKGMNLGDLSGIAITFVVIAVTLGIGATVLDSVQEGQVASSAAYNATGEGLTSLSTLADWLPTLAVIVAAAVVIGVISFAFMRN